MKPQLRKIRAVARVTILESFRRKDPYVVLILAFAIGLGAGLFNAFGVQGLEKFVKDVGLTITNLFAIIICVAAAARQLPTEIQNRTLHPLVGKPVGRGTVFLGKFVGVGVLSSAVVLAFSIELVVIALIFHITLGAVFIQSVYLRILSMWFISALVLALSLVLTHTANLTISLLLCIAMQTFSQTLLTLHVAVEGVEQRLIEALYWVLPHLELFDLSKKVVHEWPPVPAWVLAGMTVYCAIYTAICLIAGAWRFRRMPL